MTDKRTPLAEARHLASRQDHVLSRFTDHPTEPYVRIAKCATCGMTAQFWRDMSGKFQIGGDAVILHCSPIQRPAARPLTLADLDRLYPGKELYSLYDKNSSGRPTRYRIASQIKRWKRDERRFSFSIKYGIKSYTYRIESEELLAHFTTDDPETYKFPSEFVIL